MATPPVVTVERGCWGCGTPVPWPRRYCPPCKARHRVGLPVGPVLVVLAGLIAVGILVRLLTTIVR
jgi:hypothetical protein